MCVCDIIIMRKRIAGKNAGPARAQKRTEKEGENRAENRAENRTENRTEKEGENRAEKEGENRAEKPDPEHAENAPQKCTPMSRPKSVIIKLTKIGRPGTAAEWPTMSTAGRQSPRFTYQPPRGGLLLASTTAGALSFSLRGPDRRSGFLFRAEQAVRATGSARREHPAERTTQDSTA